MFRHAVKPLFIAAHLCLSLAVGCAAPQNAMTKTAAAVDLDEMNILKTLRPAHPRILLTPDDMTRLKGLVKSDAVARGYLDDVRKRGEKTLSEPPSTRVLKGPRLLDVSRRVLERVLTLGLLFQIEGERKWADRAIVEMQAVAQFSDWNPSHFLDVAEMTRAVGTGYDWFYDAMTPEQRAQIKAAIVEKGLMRGREAYEGTQPWKWWVKVAHNWNLVCNSGLLTGALVVADEEPELSAFIVSQAVKSMPRALKTYGPDGAWPEGPGYWGYATNYTVAGLGALQSALGTDFGLSQTPGLDETALFRIHAVGPTRLSFNFADAGEKTGDEPALFFLSRLYHQPLAAFKAREAVREKASPLDLLWYNTGGKPADLISVPLDARFAASNLAFMRSSWTDANALYVGFKGGDNKANHSHLDLGTFVLDALGERWASDLGGDDYNLPNYFGKGRWTYYRLRTEGHNTLLLDNQNQDPKAAAPLTAFGSGAKPFAIADLTAAYLPAKAKIVKRGLALIDNRRAVLVQDEIEAQSPLEMTWGMQTKALVELSADARTATLRLNGKELQARLIEPEDAVFQADEPTVALPQKSLQGVHRLRVVLPAPVAKTRIVVLLAPLWPDGAPTSTPATVPLDEWQKLGPVR